MPSQIKLVVLDIDSVLIDSIEKHKAERIKTNPSALWRHGNKDWAIYARPYLYSFLDYCARKFDHVAIWTKADKFWANNVINFILPKDYKLAFVWTHKHADDYKRLKKVWNTFGDTLKCDETNTLIIEDTPENCFKNWGNAIIVNPFLIEYDEDDVTFPLLCDYLNVLRKQKNIVDIDKSQWKSQVLEKLMKGRIKLKRNNNEITTASSKRYERKRSPYKIRKMKTK